MQEKISGIRQIVSYIVFFFRDNPKKFSYFRAFSYIDYLISQKLLCLCFQVSNVPQKNQYLSTQNKRFIPIGERPLSSKKIGCSGNISRVSLESTLCRAGLSKQHRKMALRGVQQPHSLRTWPPEAGSRACSSRTSQRPHHTILPLVLGQIPL